MSRTGPSAMTPATSRTLAPSDSNPPQEPASGFACCSMTMMSAGPASSTAAVPRWRGLPLWWLSDAELHRDDASRDAAFARLLRNAADDALELQAVERIGHRAGIETAQPPHGIHPLRCFVAAFHQMSSTSLGVFAPEQQIIMVAFSLRSLSVRMESRWSGMPEITRVSQAPHTPSSQEWGTWMPASRTA